MIIRDSKGFILKTLTVDFMGGNIVLEGWRDPYINDWRGIVRDCVRRDMILVLQNFTFSKMAYA